MPCGTGQLASCDPDKSPAANDAPQVGTDSAGNVYVVATGAAALQAFTSAGLGPAATTAGGEDVYLARFSATGAAQWITHIGSSADDNLGFLAVDRSGNPVVVSTVLLAVCLLGGAGWRC